MAAWFQLFCLHYLLFGLDKYLLVKGPALLQGGNQVAAEKDRSDVLHLRFPEPSDSEHPQRPLTHEEAGGGQEVAGQANREQCPPGPQVRRHSGGKHSTKIDRL